MIYCHLYIYLGISETAQILPLDLPDYLATYFGNRLSNTLRSNTGSYDDPFLVYQKNSYLGQKVLSLLSESYTPPSYHVNEYSFFIRLPLESSGRSIVRPERYFYTFTPDAITRLERMLNQIFQDRLLNFVKGSEYLYNKYRYSESIGRIRTKAIEFFCEENHVIYTPQNLAAWQKMCVRYKTQDKTFIYSVL